MAEYIKITDEQRDSANEIDLEALLRSKGETLKRSGAEWLWTRYKGVTVRGNQWYSHYDQCGGLAIDFVRRFNGMSYPEAVMYLLGRDHSASPSDSQRESKKQEKKPFALPESNKDMRDGQTARV